MAIAAEKPDRAPLEGFFHAASYATGFMAVGIIVLYFSGGDEVVAQLNAEISFFAWGVLAGIALCLTILSIASIFAVRRLSKLVERDREQTKQAIKLYNDLPD
ncbi:hypothetical protein DDZ14_04320 [Maritimibacter sp. 55A14]|uniref:hypothetical protein n=1 Tax=Maritimibacter sp. 55A14 TaxID=2174844 RepID=UPI000D617288|nr:hypothetical protein [Maritimibacter sp. 55A14]PWE33432.1 hypothetical protein DDZ14_04320 [Maritimibacter sp. 55A14]